MGSDGASAADGAFLSPAEFAREAQLSMATVRRRLKDGGIPSIQPGGPGCRVLIPREALRFDFWQALGEEQKPYPPTPAELSHVRNTTRRDAAHSRTNSSVAQAPLTLTQDRNRRRCQNEENTN